MMSSSKLNNIWIIFLILFCFYFSNPAYSEPKDIWQSSKEIKNQKKTKSNENKTLSKPELPETVFTKDKNLNLKTTSINETKITEEDEVIFGIFEPEETQVDINFWSGIQTTTLSKSLNEIISSKKNLVDLKQKIFFSKINLKSFDDDGELYLSFLSKWLMKNKKMELIDEVIYQNKILNKNTELLEFLFNHYLSNYKINKACSYTNLMTSDLNSKNLDKYKIFCHLHKKEYKIALSKLDLGIENNRFDKFFIKKVNSITGIENSNHVNYSNLLNAHLSVISSPVDQINYNNFSKKSELRNYYFKSNLYKNFLDENFINKVEENNLNKIIIFLERSANDNLIDKKILLSLYKKLTFSIDDLINPKTASKKYQRPVSHALLYQAFILSQDDFIKYEILQSFYNKLKLNGLISLADAFYNEKLTEINQDILSDKDKALIKKKTSNAKVTDELLHKSEAVNLINNRKDKNAFKSFKLFSKKIKDKEYKLTNKDLGFINYIYQEKIKLPDNLKKNVFEGEIYIPNNIFNLIEKKQKNLALLETLNFINKLENNENYLKNFLIVLKIFDKLQMKNLKDIFVLNELSFT